ncbi:hypothetical protein J6590_050746 [Homalodisca vitripennis]|nr:hypothetical protein J6590_050746 [Homalodisca vitripennis]
MSGVTAAVDVILQLVSHLSVVALPLTTPLNIEVGVLLLQLNVGIQSQEVITRIKGSEGIQIATLGPRGALVFLRALSARTGCNVTLLSCYRLVLY